MSIPPRFRIDNTDHIIDVAAPKATPPYAWDSVDIICPRYKAGGGEEEGGAEERYFIYMVRISHMKLKKQILIAFEYRWTRRATTPAAWAPPPGESFPATAPGSRSSTPSPSAPSA